MEAKGVAFLIRLVDHIRRADVAGNVQALNVVGLVLELLVFTHVCSRVFGKTAKSEPAVKEQRQSQCLAGKEIPWIVKSCLKKLFTNPLESGRSSSVAPNRNTSYPESRKLRSAAAMTEYRSGDARPS